MSLYLDGNLISLDARDPSADLNFVSHAHMDHIGGLRRNTVAIASEITKELVEARTKIKMDLVPTPKNMQLLNAGHILGSTQLYAESKDSGYSIVYTGDFQMRESPIAGRAECKRADVVVIDSTYPYEDVEFEDKEEVITAIQRYCTNKLDKGIVLFGSFSLGKPQELIKILNEVDICPVVDSKIANINRVYAKHGVDLDYICAETNPEEYEMMTRGNFVSIVENQKMRESKAAMTQKYGKCVSTAIATGLSKVFGFSTDVQFALSDHADFKQSLEYLDACSPKFVYTYGRDAAVFANTLSKAGYNATPVTPMTLFGDIIAETNEMLV